MTLIFFANNPHFVVITFQKGIVSLWSAFLPLLFAASMLLHALIMNNLVLSLWLSDFFLTLKCSNPQWIVRKESPFGTSKRLTDKPSCWIRLGSQLINSIVFIWSDEHWNTGDSDESAANKTASEPDDLAKLGCAFSLGVAFASSCGGMGTVIGTPTNVVLFGLVAKWDMPIPLPPVFFLQSLIAYVIFTLVSRYGSDTGLNFGSWAAYGAPLSLIMIVVTWVILGVIFIGPKYVLHFFIKCHVY